MLSLFPSPAFESQPEPYAEAVSRLASVRHALRLVDGFGGGPASDPEMDERLISAWNGASKARRYRFDVRSSQTVAATAAGIEALVMERRDGREPHREASRQLVDDIRRELAEVSRLILD